MRCTPPLAILLATPTLLGTNRSLGLMSEHSSSAVCMSTSVLELDARMATSTTLLYIMRALGNSLMCGSVLTQDIRSIAPAAGLPID
eukprot:3987751-Pleurochrysis_carterae.AAC.7